MLNKKKIIFLTSTRADYGKLKTLIKIFEKSKNYQTKIFVTGMHNIKLYGHTISEIRKDRIKNIYVFKNQSKNSSMTDILMNTISGFKNYIKIFKPDLLFVHGDRVEPIACALVSVLSNIKVAHIEGGEVSGTVDEILRHAISKLSQYHFVSNKVSKKRLLQMGENKKNIYVVGSPDIDIINQNDLPKLEESKLKYDLNFKDYSISILHPVTTEPLRKFEKNVDTYFESLAESKLNYIVIYPNNDLGNDQIFKNIKKYRNEKNFKILPSIKFEHYLTFLKNSKFIIGNSSSGIIEAPYFGVPTINIGNRQSNRLKEKFIINSSFAKKKILDSIKLSKNLRIKKRYLFGSGNSNKKILKILESKNFWSNTIQKNFIDFLN